MEKEYYFEIEQYLQDELTEKERLAFEKRLKEDENLAQEVELYRSIETTLTNRLSDREEESSLRNTLKDLGAQFVSSEAKKEETKVIPLYNFRKLMVAASIAAMIGLVVFNQRGTPMYGDFATTQNIELTVRDTNGVVFQNAEKAFNSKEYKESIVYFDEILTAQPTNAEVQLYKAIALVETSKFDKADSLLKHLSKGTSIYKDNAQWYLSLSKLKQKDYGSCKVELAKIGEDSQYYKQAKKLLSKL